MISRTRSFWIILTLQLNDSTKNSKQLDGTIDLQTRIELALFIRTERWLDETSNRRFQWGAIIDGKCNFLHTGSNSPPARVYIKR